MTKTVDFIGIGIGPFNLSIAALAHEAENFTSRFFDSRPDFAWHPGMLVPDCHMQTMFLKDLVSAVAPTSRFSFVNYLVKRKKFYRFLTAELRTVSRDEFSDYLSWAAEGMDNLRFNQTIEQIDFDEKNKRFVVQAAAGVNYARNICLGIGKQAYLPACVKSITPTCFHASEMSLRKPNLAGLRVAVVGGGQSGADLFLNVFRGEWGEPANVSWISRRNNFNALDEAAFANEYFTPEYVSSFVGLGESTRQKILDEQKMTSDGITADSLQAIYRELYHRFDVLSLPRNAQLLPSRSVIEVVSRGRSWQLQLKHHLDQGYDMIDCDVVIFATGYRPALPQMLSPLMSRLVLRDEFNYKVRDNFTLEWDGPRENNLFAVNASMLTHGIAEPQLSLMAWRSARILNRAMGRDLFDLSTPPALVRWRSGSREKMQPTDHFSSPG